MCWQVSFRCDSGLAAALSASGNRGHRQISELAVLQNALNNNIFSVFSATTPQSQSCDSAVPVVTSRWATESSASSGGKLAVKCDRYKTELCRTYEENGTCRYGDKCQFAHGAAELRTVARHPKYKTDLCRTFHTTGFCPYGSRCHFIHSLHERQIAVQPSRMQIQPGNLLLPQLAVKSTRLPPAQIDSRMIVEKQSLDNLIHTLSSLLQAKQLDADHTAVNVLPQEQTRKLAVCPTATEILPHCAFPPGLSCVSDTTSISTDSASPCPSPTSLNGVYDDLLTSGSCFSVKANSHAQQSSSFQSPTKVPSGVFTPPGSPGSVASSLNSLSSDYDACDWSRNVWPMLLSPMKGADVSHIPDFAHPQLLTTKHSVFAWFYSFQTCMHFLVQIACLYISSLFDLIVRNIPNIW